MTETPKVTLRPATEADLEFLLAAYAASRQIELSMLPWDDEQKRVFVRQQYAAQTDYYCEKYPDATHDIIQADGEPAGRLYVDRRAGEIAILDIAVLPECRNRGIASNVIRSLQDQAARARRSVSVYVETFNPSQKLFGELGFSVESQDEMNMLFRWNAPSG